MNNNTPYSNLKVISHLDRLNDVVLEQKRVAPVYIRIKPTNYCNHKCYYCSYADKELGLRDSVNRQEQIPWKKMQEVISNIKEMGVKAVTFSGGGEPLMYPFITEAMQSVINAGIDLSIITNGQLLRGDKAQVLTNAKWVRISFDSANAETYSRVRGINLESFEEVCNNIRQFASIKSENCELGINFVVNHENAMQVFDAAELVKELGVNHIKFTARVTKDLFEYHAPFKIDVIEQIHKAQKLETSKFKVINKYENDFDFELKSHRCYERCYINNIFTVIAANSKVYFCHDKAYVSEGEVGDISDKSFKELWYSDEVIQRYKDFSPQKECNHHCVYDDRNLLLNSYYSLDKNHINFI